MSAFAMIPPRNWPRHRNGNASALAEHTATMLTAFDFKGDGRNGGRFLPPKGCRFMQLPFDVLLEIFGWLHPPDLLHLARANKSLHGILLDKTSAGAWRNARLNLKGFPEPGIGISELRWAHLAFVPICHFCWKKKVVAPNFTLQCRICPTCAESLLVRQGALYNAGDLQAEQEIKLFFSLIPHHEFANYHRRHSMDVDTYALRSSFENVKLCFQEYDQEARERFIEVRKAFVKDASQKAEIGNSWYADSVAARQAELEVLKILRQDEIYEKLVVEGHTEGLDDFRDSISFTRHPCVKGSVRLTDRGWQSIRAKMIAFCDELKQAKRAQEHTIVYNQRKHIAVSILRDFKNDPSRMPLTMVYPNLPDFCKCPPVHAVLDLPTDVQVTIEHFQHVIPQIPALCDEWYRSLPGKVVHNALRLVDDCDESTWPVDLACKAFLCRRCSDVPPCTTASKKKYAALNITPICVPVFWPEPLTHHCATMIPTSGWARDDDATCLTFMSTQEGREVRRTEWDLALRQSDVLEEIITVIVEMAALQPKSATVADMDAEGVLFGCQKCLAGSRERLLLDWRGIARHSFEHHYFDHTKVHKWLYAMNGIDDFPKHWRILDKNYHWIRYECVRCRDLPCEALDGWSDIELDTHLRTHGVRRGVENVDYCKMFGMPDEPLLESVEIMEVSEEEISGMLTSDWDDGEDSDTSTTASSDDED